MQNKHAKKEKSGSKVGSCEDMLQIQQAQNNIQ
jgi:hypothetical protein